MPPSLLMVIAVLGPLLLMACSTPAQRWDQQAARLGLSRQVVPGTDYSHITYWHHGAGQASVLHVYLDGDGTPWVTPTQIAADPTPRYPLMLRLMAQDKAPSLYLGRPCYQGQSNNPPCTHLLWTARRYGPEVLDSMTAALTRVLDQVHYRGIIFIGYSGGGALAMLLAERFPQTRGVLTIAGNLDPIRWAALHNYSPLSGSLNPATRPPLHPTIVQLHVVGGLDRNIPEHLVKAIVSSQHSAQFVVIEQFDHSCCWEATWPSILKQLQQALGKGVKDKEMSGTMINN